ncbi:MAG: hypothetical protein ACE1Z9_01130 [Acidimicrobiia bacterium]
MDIPASWETLERRHVGPYTTSMRFRRPDGIEVEWSAWRHRKGLGLIQPSDESAPGESWWWAPHRIGWWIAGLFMAGSACFAAGSFPPTASLLGSAAGGVFFVGSIFFTTAAYLQYHEATNEGDDPTGEGRTNRLLGMRSQSVGWWAATIQLLGTLWFNVSTFNALRDLSTLQEEALVWAPDAFGSVAFLVASSLAIVEICDRLLCWKGESLVWRIAAINMVGSIAFGISAVAARIVPATGEVANATIANSFTFIGAVMFFVGALLLLPAMSESQANKT